MKQYLEIVDVLGREIIDSAAIHRGSRGLPLTTATEYMLAVQYSPALLLTGI